jgi:hypothetical protein
MANANLDVIATTHAKYVKGPVTDGVTTSSPFYFLMKEKGRLKYGIPGTTYGPGVLRTAQHDIRKWGGMDVKPIPIPRMFTNWQHDWCGYFSQWATIEWDMLENRGEEAIANMYQETADAVIDDWANFMNTLLFADGSSETPAGLVGLPGFMKATGTYGGIAQTNDYWQCNTLTGSAISGKTFESHPYAYMRRAMMNTANKGVTPNGGRPTNKPDFCITDQSAYEHIVNYHTTAFGYQPMAVNEKTFGMGWRNFIFEGMDVYYDNGCTDQTMYFLTMKDMEWVFQTKSMFATATHKIPQPIGTEAHQTWTKMALVCRSPRRQAVITSLGV